MAVASYGGAVVGQAGTRDEGAVVETYPFEELCL